MYRLALVAASSSHRRERGGTRRPWQRRSAFPTGSQPCAAAAGGGSVWVSLFSTPTLLRIDPKRNAVVGRTQIGNGACGLGYGAGSLWIEDTYDSTVSRVSATTGKRIAKIPVGAQPYDATFCFGSAWATGSADGDLERIDPASNRVVKRIVTGSGAYGVVCAFGSVWVAGPTGGVVRVDPKTNRIVARIPVASASWTAASSNAVWIATSDRRRSPASTRRRTASPRRSTSPTPALGDPAVVGGKVWVPVVADNAVAIVDPATNRDGGRSRSAAGPFVVTAIDGRGLGAQLKGADVSAPAALRYRFLRAPKRGGPPANGRPSSGYQLGLRRGASGRLVCDYRRRVCESPTLARRFPVRSRGHASTSWYLRCPYWKSPSTGPPPFRVDQHISQRSRRMRQEAVRPRAGPDERPRPSRPRS